MAWYIVNGVLNNSQAVPYPSEIALVKQCYFPNWDHIKIPKEVKVIGREAFKGYRGIGRIELSQNVERIEQEAFAQSSLTEIEIPKSVRRIEGNIFAGCVQLKKIVVPKGHPFLYIKNGLMLTREGEVLTAHPLARTACIPQGATRIGERAFEYCEQLEKVTFASSVTQIGANAFAQCKKLSEIELPDEIESIGEKAFFGCEALRDIHLPQKLKVIGAYAFGGERKSAGCFEYWKSNSLEQIDIPDATVQIDVGAFDHCRWLRSVHFGSGVTDIGQGAFLACRNLSHITFAARAVNIEKDAFNECDQIQSVEASGKVIRKLPSHVRKSLEQVWCTADVSNVPKDLRVRTYITFAENELFYSAENHAEHIRSMRRNLSSYTFELSQAICDCPQLLSLLCREKLIDKHSVDSYAEKALESGDVELIALILSYKGQICPKKDRTDDELSLDDWDDEDWADAAEDGEGEET